MTLDEVRKNIDEVDAEIKVLFKRRMELADEVARIKAESDDDIFKPDREIAILEKQSSDVDDSIKLEYRALLKRIMEVSRKYQYGRTLDLKNPRFLDYTEENIQFKTAAAVKQELYIVDSISKDSVITVDSFEELADTILSNKVDAGVAVMENIGVDVSDGLHSILTNRDLYINKCSVIEDGKYRKKVVTFSNKLIALPSHNRLKVMFVCRNRSGSLASILSMISDYDVNLTEIHSKPYIKDEWNYVFMVEMTANLLNKKDRALVYQLMNETDAFKVMGSYYCED